MNLKIVHIAAHMGAGVGKAIAGIAVNDCDNHHIIILLQEPEKMNHIEICRNHGVEVCICPNKELMIRMVSDADVVIVNWWHHPSVYDALISIQHVRARFIIWNHINGLSYPRLSYEFLKAFDAYIFTSKASYTNTLWTSEQKTQLVRNGEIVYGMGDFRPELFKPKNNYSFGQHINVGYVGSLDYVKLNPCIIDWIKRSVSQDNRVKFSLTGDRLPDIERDIKQNLLESKTSFLGFRNDIPQLLKEFDIFVYPLAPDNFATTENAIIEAMAAGLPIIASRGIVEESIITDGIDGILVSTVDEYENAFKSLLNDEGKRKELGESARNYAIKTYSVKENISHFHHVVEKAMKSNKRVHDFSSSFGNSAHEWLLSCCDDKERKTLENAISGIRFSREELLDLGRIFWGSNKGSIEQFYSYDGKDNALRKLLINMELERDNYESKNWDQVS